MDFYKKEFEAEIDVLEDIVEMDTDASKLCMTMLGNYFQHKSYWEQEYLHSGKEVKSLERKYGKE